MPAQARTPTAQLPLPYRGQESDGAVFDPDEAIKRFPRTRYLGSKRRLIAPILNELRDLEYDTVLDAFGGTGSMAYAFKARGKSVTYNDSLAFNHQIGMALIENDGEHLDPTIIETLGDRRDGVTYDDFIARTFSDIYFTDEENAWLDVAVANIGEIENRYARAIAWFALFQSAMAKRPYNLFHRRNLYMRSASVSRGFGNKATWDRSFPDHMRRYVSEANRALIDGRGGSRSVCHDALEVSGNFDLVYIDPPYINARGTGVDYRDFYHFLEGMMRYPTWPESVDLSSKHRRLTRASDPWTDAERIGDMFRTLFDRYRDSILVVSYRNDGVPSMDELVDMLGTAKSCVRVVQGWSRQYALSTNKASREILLIGTD